MAAGQRPINNVVDITNYVMLLTGQPLHAFDLDRVAGDRLTVRRARDGEKITTLDDQVRTLDAEMVVIEDDEGPTSIAGVMGGARSEVHEGTTRVLMEVATWVGPNIHRTSQVARAAQRGERPLREGPVARAGDGGPGGRDEADARAHRRDAPAGHDRRRRRGPGAEDDPAAHAGSRTSSAWRSRATGRPRSSPRSSSRCGEADDGLDVTVPHFRRNDVTARPT